MCGISLTSEFTATSSVWPSCGACDSSFTASTPAAPDLGSTITGWPISLDRLSASRRATMSAEPPDDPAAMMRTILFGHACACAIGAASATAQASAAARAQRATKRFGFMLGFL